MCWSRKLCVLLTDIRLHGYHSKFICQMRQRKIVWQIKILLQTDRITFPFERAINLKSVQPPENNYCFQIKCQVSVLKHRTHFFAHRCELDPVVFSLRILIIIRNI